MEMAVSYSLEGDLARIVAEGLYEYDEAKTVVAEALADPQSPPVVSMLMDLSESDSRRSPDELRDLAEFLASHRHRIGGRAAFLASKPLQYGLARMLEVFSDSRHVTVRAFYDYDEAIAWLQATEPSSTNQ